MANDDLKPTRGELRRLLLSPGQVEDDVRQELRFHVEERVAELTALGWNADDARAEVLRGFGDLERIASECVGMGLERIQRERRSRMFADLWNDLRYAVRTFRRNPLFASVAIGTLALGIGATTAVFTVVDRVALRDLPLFEPDRLVAVWETNLAQGIATDNPSPPNLYDWQERSRSFEGFGAWTSASATLTGVERPEVLDAVGVTWNFFSLLGVQPQMGRGFVAGEDNPEGPQSIILSHEAWQRMWGGAEMLGHTVNLDGTPFEVVGIMPPGMATPRPGVDVFFPSQLANPNAHRQTRYLNVIGRLAAGVSIETAQAELSAVHRQLGVEHPEANAGWSVTLVPAKDQVVGDSSRTLWVVLAAVAMVLLIACVNVANLLLGRTATRRRELDVRTAIGASGSRIRRQLLTESLAIGLMGGALGIVLAHQLLGIFLAMNPGLPRAGEVGMDVRILLFVLAVSVGTALFFGVAPAAQAVRGQTALRGGRRSERTRRLLVSAEIALSLVLLVGAGTFWMSFRDLLAVDPGFGRDGAVAAKVSLERSAYPTDEARVQYFETLIDELEAVPGVAHAAVTSTLPMDPSGTDFDLPRLAEGHPSLPEGELPQTDYRIVSPGYLDAMGMQLVRGRDFTRFDRAETPPVILITESFADALWPGEDPLGKHITIYYNEEKPWEVVGVVGDVRHNGLATPASQQMFVPMAQAEFVFGYMTVVARAADGQDVPVNAIRDAASALDPNEPLFAIAGIADLIAASVARDRLVTVAVGALSLLALLLATAGVYAVVSYQVSRRTREIGVKMAVGATRGRVVRDVLTDTLTLAGLGVGAGLVLAVVATRVGQSVVFGLTAFSPTVLLGVTALMLFVSLVAAVPPALRAADIDPILAIRTD